MATDLNKGTAVPGRHRFRAIALTDNVSLLTAWGDNTAYERIFLEQVSNFLKPRDVLIAISGNANSPTVVAAAQWARAAGAVTIALTGGDGGRLRVLADRALVVPTNRMEHIEDAHLTQSHALCTSLRTRMAAMTPMSEAAGA